MTDNIEIIQTIIIVINFKMESGIRMNIIIGGTDENNATFMSFTNVLFQKYLICNLIIPLSRYNLQNNWIIKINK